MYVSIHVHGQIWPAGEKPVPWVSDNPLRCPTLVRTCSHLSDSCFKWKNKKSVITRHHYCFSLATKQSGSAECAAGGGRGSGSNRARHPPAYLSPQRTTSHHNYNTTTQCMRASHRPTTPPSSILMTPTDCRVPWRVYVNCEERLLC
ncbi:hypothetical protein J6590_029292 [Homalodisca vitripennis]|nr:hypothetical protein J6590_029292 [Homalodisca vitripennis]